MATTMDRKLSGSKPAVPGQRGATGGAGPEKKAPRLTKKKKLVLIAVLVLLLAGGGGAGWFFLLGPGAGEPAVVAEPEPIPGEVLPLESLTVNLAEGSYLQLGLALQAEEGVGEELPLDGSKALDLAIDLFSGRTVAELSAPELRNELKAELTAQVAEAYHDEVYEVYFTEFVMQ